MEGEEARWVTFQALAEARGTSKRAAVVLVRRRGWPKQRNNAGHVTALVPLTALKPKPDGGGDNVISSHAQPDAGHVVAVLERTVEALVEAHARERAALQAQLDQARAEAQEARQAADQLRRADDARRARGRWARLRAAWQGE